MKLRKTMGYDNHVSFFSMIETTMTTVSGKLENSHGNHKFQ